MYVKQQIMKKTGQEFEEEQGGIDGKVWREKREGRNVVILSSKKLKRICHRGCTGQGGRGGRSASRYSQGNIFRYLKVSGQILHSPWLEDCKNLCSLVMCLFNFSIWLHLLLTLPQLPSIRDTAFPKWPSSSHWSKLQCGSQRTETLEEMGVWKPGSGAKKNFTGWGDDEQKRNRSSVRVIIW